VRPSESEVHDAIDVILADRTRYDTSLNYAVNYCVASMHMSGEALRVQCLYIVNNIEAWRHPLARRVRRCLREFCKP
jgi:hypothetical protein